MNIIKEHKQAFSLRDEIGQCPSIKIDIDVIDDSLLFVRPFPIHEEYKLIMDKYMAKLVSLGILTKNNTTHTSPVMLVSRKGTKNKRPVVDFRLLNTRIMRRNAATPLLRDIFKMLGRSKCEVLSCVDLKDAFHSLGLTDRAKEFCGVLPYFGSPHYRYEVLPVGLSISPQVWITYIENLLEGIPNRQAYIAIMDDLMLHGLKADHMQLFKQLLVSLILHGLKLSPRSANISRRFSNQYMNSLEKKCHFTGQGPIKKLLSKSKNCSSNPQYCIYLDLEVDSYYIVIPLRPIQVVPYGKCRMANLDY